MGKNRQQAGLVNVINYDENNNLSLSSSPSSSIQTSGSVIATSITGSFTGSVFGLGDTVSFSSSVLSQLNTLQVTSGSNIERLNNLESKSSSVDTSISNINIFTSSNANTSLNQLTGSLATTGSNTFYGTQVFSGSVFIATDLIVQGSSSIQYISASSVSIGTNIVNLNTATPSVRFAGISVQDSGSSAGITGSMLWDSLCNRWIYSNPSTIGYSGGLLMSGPRAATLGSETTLTCNYIAKSGGGDHLYDSCIWEMSGSVGINCATPSYNLDVNGTLNVATSTGSQIRLISYGGSSAKIRGTQATLGIEACGALTLETNGANERLRIESSGVASFSCQVCANALIASNGIRANNGSITSCNGTIGGAAVFIADAPDNTSDIGYRVHIGGSLKWFIGLPNNVVNDNFSIFQGGCSTDRLTIDTVGNIGIGTSSPVTTNLNGALTIWKCYNNDGASVPSTTAQTYYGNQHGLYLFGRNSGLSIISANSEEGSIKFGNASTNAYATIGTTTGASSVGGDMYFRIGSDTERWRIFSTGIACFNCQVCVPQLVVCKTYNANNLMLSVANSTMSVPFMTYDTAIIQADDVTTLKLVERNGGATDNQILTLSVGDNTTRISTNGPNPLQFFVGGSSAGCGYNGLGGKNALSIACSGISTFSYPVNMGSIGHYNNYSNTSGCFAVFCASQGAILYVTSMHNGGRSTYQLLYSNGATGGASISVIGSTSAYGPSNTGFALCANGWVYAHQVYGGPTDYYAISMNSNFAWAF